MTNVSWMSLWHAIETILRPMRSTIWYNVYIDMDVPKNPIFVELDLVAAPLIANELSGSRHCALRYEWAPYLERLRLTGVLELGDGYQGKKTKGVGTKSNHSWMLGFFEEDKQRHPADSKIRDEEEFAAALEKHLAASMGDPVPNFLSLDIFRTDHGRIEAFVEAMGHALAAAVCGKSQSHKMKTTLYLYRPPGRPPNEVRGYWDARPTESFPFRIEIIKFTGKETARLRHIYDGFRPYYCASHITPPMGMDLDFDVPKSSHEALEHALKAKAMLREVREEIRSKSKKRTP